VSANVSSSEDTIETLIDKWDAGRNVPLINLMDGYR